MKNFLLMIFGVALVASAPSDEPSSSSLITRFSEENNLFIGELYKELAKTNPENFLVCPLSLQTVFALLADGAKGNTSDEIATGLHLPQDSLKRGLTFWKLAKTLQGNEKYILSNANKIYVSKGFKINSNYEKSATTIYKSEIQNIDFAEPQEAVKEMNKWVEGKTDDKIKDLLNQDMVSPQTVAVLINALYFQGKWLKNFETVLEMPFYFNQSAVLMNLMKVVDDFNYYDSPQLKAKFLELPYQGDDMTLTIVLPNKPENLPLLENQISEVLVAPKFEMKRVSAFIPKFKIDTTIPFVPILKNLGINEAFTSNADFSGISDEEKMTISEVVQKNFIEVDEKGTVAASATAIIANRMGGIDYDYSFVANHPFIFYLKHRINGVVFIGRYSTPSASESEPWSNS